MKTLNLKTMVLSFISILVEESMRALKLMLVLSCAALVLFATACSESGDSTPYFQNNVGNLDPTDGDGGNPFDGLPDIGDPAVFENPVALIAEAFNPGSFNLTVTGTEYQGFADRMEDLRVDMQTAVDEVLYKMDDIANDGTYAASNRGIYGLVGALRNIMGYMMTQDGYDDGGYSAGAGDMTDDLYAYLLDIDEADLDIKNDALDIGFKTLNYLNNTYDDPTTNAIMTDLISFLSDSTDQNFSGLLINLQEALGKLLMRADSNISYDDSLDWYVGSSGALDIGLGNSVYGIDLLLQAINNMVSENNTLDAAEARADLYGILRETGKLMNAGGSSTAFKNRTKQLLCNIEDYYTTGGANFTSDYYQALSGSPQRYVNAELRNAVKEMWPGLVKLFIREKDPALAPDYSIIHQTNGARTRSPIEWLTRALYQLKSSGIDYSDSDYYLEPSLKRMVEYNGFGTTRAGMTDYRKVSFLDHLTYTIAGAYNFGFLTRGSCSGEPYDNTLESGSYGHGTATRGILTLNDSLYGMTSRNKDVKVLGITMATLDSYGLSVKPRVAQGSHVWRRSSSTTGFTYNDANKNNYRFYMGYDYPPLLLLPESCAGDAGIPNGGQLAQPSTPPNSDSTTPSTVGSANRNDYRSYYPKTADGKGILNTSSWVMSWISRACWDGAGPYYSTSGSTTNSFAWPGKGTRTVNVYYKPNGEVYAYVYKTTNPWEYYYPTSATSGIGNDVADPDANANGQRFNRYRDICKSDFFMVEAGDEGDFCSPPMNPNSTSYADATSGANKFRLNSGNNAAQCFWLYEKVQELTNSNIDVGDGVYDVIGNTNRECATQEEAIYRNFQWLMLEKKFMFPLPMNITTTVAGCVQIDVCAFVLIEGNGIVGLSSGKKNTNGLAYWNIRNSEGLGTHTNYPAGRKNLIDYGDSLRPGDSRIIPFAKYFSSFGNDMSPEVIYNDILGNGHVMPDAVGANIGPLARLGFLESSLLTSDFSTGSASWTNRNKILPIFVALAGVLMDGSYYDTTGVTNYDYNWSATAKHKYPLNDLLEGVMIPLAKPMMRYFNDQGGRWVPRMEDEDINNSSGGAYTDEYSFFMPDIYGDARDPNYYPRSSLRTLTSFLAGNSDNTVDGLLPLITDNTNLVSKLLSLIQRLGNNEAGSPYRDDELNILADFSKGLEQIVTSIQVDKGAAISAGYTYSDAGRQDPILATSRYGWMFHTGTGAVDRRSGTPVSVDLTAGLNELIGDDTRGISEFVDDRGGTYNNALWANYDRMFDAMAAMMGNTSSGYYILDNDGVAGGTVNDGSKGVIGIMNKFLTGTTASSDDLKSLRHTLGTLMTRYSGGTWGPTTATPTNSELYQIVRQYLPDILNAYNRPPTNEFHYLLPVLIAFMDVDRDGTLEPEEIEGTDTSNLDYLTSLLIQGDTPQEIIESTYELMNRDAMWDPAYYTAGGYPNHATIKELADICESLADRL
ncbi:MAG: hypothetical protein KBC90_02805 [Spirochaetes bacterium]|nr:hypothetical protein [Spirochaetota bacterium]HOD15994.1 hypothetical protein [Spirochaetota bacterium]